MELTRELTIGQRTADTPIRLHTFLQRRIFPKLGQFSIELYLRRKESTLLLPPVPLRTSAIHGVPESLPSTENTVLTTLGSSEPTTFHSDDKLPHFLEETGNATHLLAPILDTGTTVGVLYVGAESRTEFAKSFIYGLSTLSAVIGSRLKSMETIRQLKYSMQALEYSERIRSTLYHISEQAHNSSSPDELYLFLHQTINKLIHAPNFVIALVEQRQNGEFIRFPYFADRYESKLQGCEIQLDPEQKSLTGYLLDSKEPLLLNSQDFDKLCKEEKLHYIGRKPYSWLGAPFHLDHLSGAVIIQSYEDITYTDKDKRLMAYVAQHVGDALNRRKTVDELKLAKKHAERMEKNKSIFLANMSHEIRNPMNGIIGMTELALRMDMPITLRNYLSMIHNSGDRLLRLINNILDFSKIEAGELDIVIAPFELRKVIHDTLQIPRFSASEKNIALHLECDEEIPDILLGDSCRLYQAITNLVNNSIKFTTSGRVLVKVKQFNKEPATSTKNGEAITLHFQIQDTGVGIPANKIQDVFQAFTQFETSPQNNNRGTGLGLMITAELVELMGGQIWVDSTPGIGSTFHFTIEFQLPKEEFCLLDHRPTKSSYAHLPSEPLKILLAEDEYINRTLATTVLEQAGWQVSQAANGLEVLERLQHNSFDLILMDIQMPEMDGLETTRIIRRRERLSGTHIPIIAMTAYAVKGDKEKFIKEGMDGYISKPIKANQLHHEIQAILYTGSHMGPARDNVSSQEQTSTPEELPNKPH